MTRLLATFIFLLSVFTSTAAQPQSDSFSQTQRIGRGAVLNAQWHPSGNFILVDTVTGAWLYNNTLADVAYLPDVRLARFNSDGKIIAGIDDANSLTFWDSTTYAQIDSYPGNTAYVIAMEWSPNQSQIATLDRSGRILVWDLATKTIQFETRLNGANQMAWSKNGSYLAANSHTEVLVVWDQMGKLVFQDKPQFASDGADIEWRNDTQILQLQFFNGYKGRLWDVPTEQMMWERQLGYDNAFSPNGNKIAISGIDTVGIEEAETGVMLNSLGRPQWAAIAWSPDGQQVAFGDRTLPQVKNAITFIVDARTGKIVQEITSSNVAVKYMYWSPDGTRLLTVYTTEEIKISNVNLQNNNYFGNYSTAHTDIGAIVAWNEAGTRLMVSTTDDGSRLWDAETGEILTFRMNMTGLPATQIVWQPGGTLVATTSDDGWTSMYHNVYIWETANPEQELMPVAIIPHAFNVRGFAWNPDGKSLVTAESSWFLHLWKPETPNMIQTLDVRSLIGDGSGITRVAWSYKGDIVVVPNSGWTDGAIALIDVASETLLPGYSKEPLSDGIHGISSWAWTPDNQFMAMGWGSFTSAGAYDFRIQILYDPASAAPHNPIILSGLPKPAAKAIFSPHATKVIGFDQVNNAIIWDLEPQSVRVRLVGVTNAVWSPDESMLVVYDTNGIARVIDANTGDTLSTFDGHSGSVFWSPDSRKIALLDRGALYIYETHVS